MSTADHKRWSEELAAYMLGALDPREAEDFERHLEGCEHCQEELRWLEPAVHSLPDGVERAEPPPQLRASLMAEVRAEAEAETRPAPAKPAGRRRWFMKPAVGFAVLALLVAGVVGYEVGKDGGGSDNPVAFEKQINGMTVTMIQEGDGGRLELAGVPQPPEDKVFEAWVERDGEVEAVPALIVPDRHGHAETTIADMSGVETLMITVEPRGGSETPTGETVMEMAIPQ
ncbi:MAG TPA: anti-sigma factor [Solirubrobacterales bacterium]|nr:anti-sigma factor [Solirubrobacterales bacterium]